jgi:acetyl esterase/lipase
VPIRAVISFYGPSDLNLGYTDLPSPDPMDVRSVLTTYLGGPPGAVPERYHAASAVLYAGGKLPPTLLIQGARDHIVKPVFARELHEKLRAAGNQSVLLEIPWAEHAFDAVFSGPGNQLALFYSERFLDATLRDRM